MSVREEHGFDGSLPKFGRVRTRASDNIVREIRRQIANDELTRGEQLPNERELAHQFGVSQPTIREAISALAAIGLVRVQHGSGTYVAADSQELVSNSLGALVEVEGITVAEVLWVRGLLGKASARAAATNATGQELARIEELFEITLAAEDATGRLAAVEQFQLAVSMAAHQPLLNAIEAYLIRLAMRFQRVALRHRSDEFWRDWTARVALDRKALMEALSMRDTARAEEAMQQYLSHQQQLFASESDLAEMRLDTV